jgi:exodeoxyribonuclease III
MKGSKWKVSPFCRRLKAMGYHAYWHAGTRASGGYGGTLFLSLVEPENVIIGTGDCQIDAEGRFMSLVFSDAIVTNLYAPTLNMELKGQQRKTDFWRAAEKRHRQIQRRYPGRASIWAGDMNVAPASKDAAAEGIRRRLELTAPKTAALLKDELPSQTQHERDELQQLQDRLGLVDAFEHQKDPKMGRDARAKDRYSQYGHGFRKDGLGQRVDLILTDIPMIRTGPLGPDVTEVRVLTNERGSDHLPVEATFNFPAPFVQRLGRFLMCPAPGN